MRIGCLQFSPQVGEVDNNLNRADSVLNRADPGDLDDLDLLVLPEMAFTGYHFKSLQEIMPFLEPAGSGISALWARTTALRYDCKVVVGYPEKVDISSDWPTSPQYYNSVLMVNEDGETIVNYRKSFLYYTDETWALEGPGFFAGEIEGLGQTSIGICMDINPYKFEAPWHAFEFAFHVLDSESRVAIVSMAWNSLEDSGAFCSRPGEPDMRTLEYWAQRLEPLIRAEHRDEVIIIFANRCGMEGETLYAGTSAVLGVLDGEVNVYGVLGRGSKELLVVDTDLPPFAKLVSRPGRKATEGEFEATSSDDGDSRRSQGDDDAAEDHTDETPAPVACPPPPPPPPPPQVEPAAPLSPPSRPPTARDVSRPSSPACNESSEEQWWPWQRTYSPDRSAARSPPRIRGQTPAQSPARSPERSPARDTRYRVRSPSVAAPAQQVAPNRSARTPPSPRDVAEVVSPVRPRLTISTSTEVSPSTPKKAVSILVVPEPQEVVSQFPTFPVPPGRDLFTPPLSGLEEKAAAAASAAAVSDRETPQGPGWVGVYTPDEPQWPPFQPPFHGAPGTYSPGTSAVEERLVFNIPPPPPPPPPPQRRLSDKTPSPSPNSVAEVVVDARPLGPPESSQLSRDVLTKRSESPKVEVAAASPAAPETVVESESVPAEEGEECPLILVDTSPSASFQRRGRALSDTSISIRIGGLVKDALVVERYRATSPQQVTVSLSFGRSW